MGRRLALKCAAAAIKRAGNGIEDIALVAGAAIATLDAVGRGHPPGADACSIFGAWRQMARPHLDAGQSPSTLFPAQPSCGTNYQWVVLGSESERSGRVNGEYSGASIKINIGPFRGGVIEERRVG